MPPLAEPARIGAEHDTSLSGSRSIGFSVLRRAALLADTAASLQVAESSAVVGAYAHSWRSWVLTFSAFAQDAQTFSFVPSGSVLHSSGVSDLKHKQQYRHICSLLRRPCIKQTGSLIALRGGARGRSPLVDPASPPATNRLRSIDRRGEGEMATLHLLVSARMVKARSSTFCAVAILVALITWSPHRCPRTLPPLSCGFF